MVAVRVRRTCSRACVSIHTRARNAHRANERSCSMKPTLALSLVAVLAASACAIGDDDPVAADEEQDQGQTHLRKDGSKRDSNPPPLTLLTGISVTPSPLPGGHP